MVLMKSYVLIKRVELEVEQVSKVQTPEASPPVSMYLQLVVTEGS